MASRAVQADRPAPGQHYHLIGVAGVGMSALAHALAACGATVSGSDRFLDRGEDLEIFRKLERAGIALRPQDGTGVIAGTHAVVCSTAIEDDNPDLMAARRAHVPVVHRAAMLARFCAGQRCAAVSGTAGKTTVTGMVAWILEQLGMDPNVVNGGALVDWRGVDRVGNARPGASDLWVVEADESDRSLLQFQPTWSAITNISRDHFDLDELVDLFAVFAEQTDQAVVCGPSVADQLRSASGRDVRAACLVPAPGDAMRSEDGWGFSYRGRRFASPLPGRHNAENGLVAVTLCEQIGCEAQEAARALATFRGIERRLECVGSAGGVRVLDEYAHNPAKIAAAWSVAREEARRIVGVWRPHGFAPLRLMWDDLVDVFADLCSGQDRLYLLPVYYAGGTAETGVSSDQLADVLRGRGANVGVVHGYPELTAELADMLREGDTLMIMGARDPQLPVFARDLALRLDNGELSIG